MGDDIHNTAGHSGHGGGDDMEELCKQWIWTIVWIIVIGVVSYGLNKWLA
jgi:hypothetical protein